MLDAFCKTGLVADHRLLSISRLLVEMMAERVLSRAHKTAMRWVQRSVPRRSLRKRRPGEYPTG